MGSKYLLEVKNLVKHFPIQGGLFGNEVGSVNALSDVSFSIAKGETLGLVGESGCGKTTLGRSILRLLEPTSGQIIFDGTDITRLNSSQMRKMRQRMQIIFQDPYAALNPRMTVNSILMEPLKIHGLCKDAKGAQKRILQLLDYVQLSKDSLGKYPHQFSGGQRQRICIARALAVEPEFIICDEPVSALDVSVQAQVINLLMDLQKELGLTFLFIAHDLKVIEYLSNRVAVMYLGKVVEIATASELYGNPKHPYTNSLFSAIPKPDPDPSKLQDRIILEGDVPSPMNPPSGCHFHPRCYRVLGQCKSSYPEITGESQTHEFRCFNPLG